MGASPPTDEPRPVPAALTSTRTPEVTVERAEDSDESRVFVEGTMYHAGLNANAWGLTESGAQAIAEDLVGRDYTAGHPPVRGTRYDRAIAEGQGASIGEVVDTEVVAIEGATIDGGQYTAQYTAEITDPIFKPRLEAGLRTGGEYGSSVGIYADPESATCSVCGEGMASDACDHSRGETVEADDGEEVTAGPLYDDGDADHLAHVWRPAYEGATADVQAASVTDYASDDPTPVLSAEAVLAEPFDAEPVAAMETAADESDDDTAQRYDITLSSDSATRRRDRGSYPVRFNND